MKMSKFITEVQEIIDRNYSNLKHLIVYVDRGQPTIAVGLYDKSDSFAIGLGEWVANNEIQKMDLVKIRILDMLQCMKWEIEDYIKEIRDAETKRT